MKYSFLLLAILLIGCTSPPSEAEEQEKSEKEDVFSIIEDQKAREIIRSSIEYAGGMENWKSIKQLTYTKDFSLLLESGELEKEFKQKHDYRWNPEVIDILSEENGVMIQTRLENGQYTRNVDNEEIQMEQESLAKAVNTSVYVISMPFKFLDPGAVIKYLGEETLNDKKVEVVQISYNSDLNENHSTSDVWRYYFDQEDSKIVANWVQTGDHFSRIENITYERVGGILFNKERKSFRVDSLGNKLFLRAHYFYDNYELSK